MYGTAWTIAYYWLHVYALQYPEGYLEAVAAKEKEKEKEKENEDEVAETPTKGKRKRKSLAGECNSFNFLSNCYFLNTEDMLYI